MADVEPARTHAAAVVLAGRPVRYTAATPDQTGRQGRRAEAEGETTSAVGHAGSNHLRPRAGAHATPDDLTHGADAPYPPVLPTPNADSPHRANHNAQNRAPSAAS